MNFLLEKYREKWKSQSSIGNLFMKKVDFSSLSKTMSLIDETSVFRLFCLFLVVDVVGEGRGEGEKREEAVGVLRQDAQGVSSVCEFIDKRTKLQEMRKDAKGCEGRM